MVTLSTNPVAIYGREYYQRNKEKVAERNRRYKAAHPELAKKYYAKHRTEVIARVTAYYEARPGMKEAQKEARRMIPYFKPGTVCAVCGGRPEVRHHPDYSAPLWVIPLCQRCHSRVHLGKDSYQEVYGRKFEKTG